jgi:hypothetical protein
VSAIRFTQHIAREGNLQKPPRWPMIILRTPKGWHSIPELEGKRIEDNHTSHQVIAEFAKTNETHLEALETWLRSYHFAELFLVNHFIDGIESLDTTTGASYGQFVLRQRWVAALPEAGAVTGHQLIIVQGIPVTLILQSVVWRVVWKKSVPTSATP